jgi:[acyl-carrier-protein] S-malonyltransferase
MDCVAAVAGHSLGEFSALAAAGTLPWETVLRLVREEGLICARAIGHSPGGMVAVIGLEAELIGEIMIAASHRGDLWIANFNAPDQFVLSGQEAAAAEAARLALAAGARRAVVLNIPVPAHSPMMSPALDAFRAQLDKLEFAAPDRPVVANGSGLPLTTLTAIRAELDHHMVRPVLWSKTMTSISELHIRTVVELGPSRVLASLALKNIPGVQTWTADELFIDAPIGPSLEWAMTPA